MDVQGHEYDFFIGAKDVILNTEIPAATKFWPYGLTITKVNEMMALS